MKYSQISRHKISDFYGARGYGCTARNRILLIALLFASFVIFRPSMSSAQDKPTSTPDAQGDIYYVVQAGDSLWSIAARSGLGLEELLRLNDIQEDSVVNPGDLLLIGNVTPPPTPTLDIPTATRPPPSPTVTPISVRTAICMLAFNDLNRNGKHDAGESLQSGVAFTLFNDQIVVANYATDGLSEPFCLEGLEAGTYHVTRSISPNEVLTTQGDWAMTLPEGGELNLAFGSYLQEANVGIDELDRDSQFETRVAGTPSASPPAAAQANGRAIAGIPLMMVLLGIGIIALLLAVAVLLFWFAYSRMIDN